MKCPICNQESVRDYRPFCSRRCAYIDLGNWLNEDYRIDDGSLFADEEHGNMSRDHDNGKTDPS
ncbi:MAG: DNA gyrase inhibitor YacG [Rhodobacteraceae bacterium]|nr:DNA gyrase inhibitor YacG [Paracoccaceae bacterium]